LLIISQSRTCIRIQERRTHYRTVQIRGEARGGVDIQNTHVNKQQHQQKPNPAGEGAQICKHTSKEKRISIHKIGFLLEKNKKKMRPKNKDPYRNNSQEIRSGVPTARSTNNDDLGFQIAQKKWRKRRGKTHLLREDANPRHLQQIEREGRH